MFTGVRSHQDAGRVDSYATAEAALERAMLTPTGRRRTEKEYGFHLGMSSNHGVTWVRKDDDGTINFRLYDTDVVIWYPDNSFVVDNFGTVTTSGFARTFLPGGISLAHPVTIRGNTGGHRGIYYGVDRGDSYWGTRMVCFGGLPRFRQHGEDWLPDEDTLDTVKFPELDQRAARELSREYPFKDFEAWLSMAPLHMDLEHEGYDLDQCCEALKSRNFTNAAQSLPLITIPYGWGAADRIKPLPIRCSREGVITMGSLKKLRLAIYADERAFSTVKLTTIRASEFDRRIARTRELVALDAYRAHEYGPYA